MLVLWLAFLGCDSRHQPSQTVPNAALRFDYAGCARVRTGPICELQPSRVLRVWVEGKAAPAASSLELELERIDSQPIDGGQAASFIIPTGAREVTLRAGSRQGLLKVAPSSEPQLLGDAKKLRSNGEWQAARELLEAQGKSLSPAEASRARALLARIHLAKNEIGKAIELLVTTTEEAYGHGLLSESAYDALALAFTLTYRQRNYSAARQWLKTVAQRFGDLPEIRALLPYYHGILKAQTGQRQDALLLFRQAALLADRLGLASDSVFARQELTRLQHRLGQRREALRNHQRLMDSAGDSSPCVRVSQLLTLAWFQLLSDEAEVRAGARTSLREAEGALDACPRPGSVRDHRLNLTYHALQQHRLEEAERQLARLAENTEGKTTRLAMWEALFRAKLEASRENPREVIAHARQVRLLADAAGWPEQAHASWLAQAKAHENLGELAPARQAYEEAESLADHLVRLVPLGEGQQLFALQLESSAEGLISLYLESGAPRKALEAAKRARRRLLAASWRSSQIEALDGESLRLWETAIAEYRSERAKLETLSLRDWQLPHDELLAAKATREISLQRTRNALANAYAVLHRVAPPLTTPSSGLRESAKSLLIARDDEQWLAFLSLGPDLIVHPLGHLSAKSPTTRWSEALFPVFEQLLKAEGVLAPEAPARLRVALHPTLAHLDIHALDFRGQPLLNALPISYALEAHTEGAAEARGASSAVSATASLSSPGPVFSNLFVVGDPTVDLPYARSEAEAVARSVRAEARRTLFGAEATKQQVLDGWSEVGLFHFSGHASYQGLDGLQSYLALAGGTKLEMADVLAATTVPEHVVLAACESASGLGERGGGLSFSLALIAAGSQTVVAPSRTVSDELSQRFTRSLYRALTDTTDQAWATALQQASLELRETHPEADWSSFRLMTLN